MNFELTRSATNATWYPQKSVVQYNETFVETETDSEPMSGDMLTINMAAYDAWEQMLSKPKWFKAW